MINEEEERKHYKKSRDIVLVNKHLLYTRLSVIFNLNTISKLDRVNVINLFKEKFYSEFNSLKIGDLHSKYKLELEVLDIIEITTQTTGYLKPGQPYYKEILFLNSLVHKHFKYALFKTMVGDFYYTLLDKLYYKKYVVVHIQETYKSEQVFLLQTLDGSDTIVAKENEWSCEILKNPWFVNKEVMLKCLLEKITKDTNEKLERIERLVKEIE